MYIRKFIFLLTLFVLSFPQLLLAETITVSNQSAQPGDTVEVTLKLDTSANTLGAVFTVNFNTEYLTLLQDQVSSPFFQSFAQQWAESPYAANPAPPSQVIVEGVTYVQPFVMNPVTGGVMFAAVNIDAGKTENTLFVLQFKLSETIPDGIYPISVSTSFITNSNAGYPEDGTGVPLLYPGERTSVISGRISINTDIADSDGDGIDDSWEIQIFGNLTMADSLSDFDGDGYSDLQEFLNQLSGLFDGNGAQFDPKKKNELGGVGFVSLKVNSTILKMLIPIIMENSTRR